MAGFWGVVQGLAGVLVGVFVFLVHLAVVARAITRPHRSAVSRVAWVAVIMFLPVVGVIAYLFLGETSVGRRREEAAARAVQMFARPHDAAHAPAGLHRTDVSLFRMGHSVNGFAPTTGNRITLAADTDAAIAELVADIDRATQTVHISFYIWLDDRNGKLVAEAVARAAQRGVTCRIMVDALGSRAFTKSASWRLMGDAGAQLTQALDDVPRVGNLAVGRPDLRNHRKIVVIDNRIAFCGSQNCADAAFEVKPAFAPWVDVFFRCEGPVVAQEQWLFLTAWAVEDERPVPFGLAAEPQQEFPDGAVGQMFGTGPTDRAGAMSDMFVTAIAAARETLTVTTPYFVPDGPVLAALCAAPRRGVKTILVLPQRNDSWLVANAADSDYEQMLDAGIELYEYPLGLLHAKTLTVDGQIALVGSANMDRRSLELNYENNLVVTDPHVATMVRARQQAYIDASDLVIADAVRGWSFGRRLVQNTVGMLAPLL